MKKRLDFYDLLRDLIEKNINEIAECITAETISELASEIIALHEGGMSIKDLSFKLAENFRERHEKT